MLGQKIRVAPQAYALEGSSPARTSNFMDLRRISDILKLLANARARGAKLTGKSALEKELHAYTHSLPVIDCAASREESSIDFPSRYEDEFLRADNQ